MEIIDRGSMKILKADVGYILYNKQNDSYSETVYLGKYGNIDDYEEIVDRDIQSKMYKEIESLKFDSRQSKDKIEEQKDINDTQDVMIDISMMAMDELYCMFEPILAMMPMTLSMREVINPMVELYVVMVQRGLKTLDQVPARYREQVAELLDAVEE